MRRGTTREKTEALLDEIRQRVPEIAIRTTMIAGHPGESEQDFEELMGFVERSRFERLGIFTYSHEENTHSYSFEDNIPEEVKQNRANQVMELQESISLELNQRRVGNAMKVLVDRFESGNFIGRTEYDSPEVDNEVIIDGNNDYLKIGEFANVKINEATAFDLYGTLVRT